MQRGLLRTFDLHPTRPTALTERQRLNKAQGLNHNIPTPGMQSRMTQHVKKEETHQVTWERTPKTTKAKTTQTLEYLTQALEATVKDAPRSGHWKQTVCHIDYDGGPRFPPLILGTGHSHAPTKPHGRGTLQVKPAFLTS